MEYREIKKLMDDMGNSKLSEVEIEFPDGIKISMKKEQESKTKSIELPTTQINVNSETTVQTKEECKEEGKYITAPMVGTFYAKASPNAEPYVKVGDKIKKGDIVCLLEAMKLMNEIESELDGEIVEVLVKDSEMVEYGQKLFKIR